MDSGEGSRRHAKSAIVLFIPFIWFPKVLMKKVNKRIPIRVPNEIGDDNLETKMSNKKSNSLYFFELDFCYQVTPEGLEPSTH